MKKLIIPLILLVLLGAVALYYYFNSSPTTFKKERSDFAISDTGAIDKIFLADKANNTVLLERQSASKWMVNRKFEARPDAINNLLETIKRISVKAPVPKASFGNVVKQIASSSIKVELYMGGEEPEKVYYVGGANQHHSGSYMLMEGSSSPFLMHIEGLHGFLGPRFFTNANEWKLNIICRYDYGEIASVRVETPREPAKSFEIKSVSKDAFTLKATATGEMIADYDTNAVRYFVASFKNVPYESYEETKTPEFIDSIKTSTPVRIITIKTHDGSTKQMRLFLKPAPLGGEDLEGNPITLDMERLYCLVDGIEFFVVQYFIFDTFLLTIDKFIKHKPVENS